MYTPVGAGPDLKISPSYSSKTEKALFPTTPIVFFPDDDRDGDQVSVIPFSRMVEGK